MPHTHSCLQKSVSPLHKTRISRELQKKHFLKNPFVLEILKTAVSLLCRYMKAFSRQFYELPP